MSMSSAERRLQTGLPPMEMEFTSFVTEAKEFVVDPMLKLHTFLSQYLLSSCDENFYAVGESFYIAVEYMNSSEFVINLRLENFCNVWVRNMTKIMP
ncbi:hypothetical protein ElyMa_000499300 [Elysia marginata]|uniref:Uncharacterized protein n=1 Tax=Elysia marginata TaxID=1093978 RepID=A0AAV4FV25_9GAST|nr:hypothetical protein ElyMa_000499300 [Elysia marginata]